MDQVFTDDESRVPPGEGPGQANREIEIPVTPAWLEDGRLLDYRHPSEYAALAVALAVLAGVVIAGGIFRSKEILLGVGAVWLSMLVTSSWASARYMISGAEVTSTQFPAIHEIVEELRVRFQVPPTRVFVVRKASVETVSLGLQAPYVIVLYSALLDSLKEDELRFVLGQHMGRIRFGHTRVAVLLGGDEASLPALLAWIAPVRDIFFAWYWRAQAMSTDRAGLLACRSLRVGARTIVRLAVGNNQLAQVQLDGLFDQAAKAVRQPTYRRAQMILLQSSKPPLLPRLAALLKWAQGPEPE